MKNIHVAAASIVLLSAAAVAGCGGETSSTQASTLSPASSSNASSGSKAPTAATGAGADHTNLLIKGSDISEPGVTFTASAPTLNPSGHEGVAVVFSNEGDTEEVGDTILILPDESTAAAAIEASRTTLGSSVIGGEPKPSPVGSNGTVISGTSPDGSKSVTVLLFNQGRAAVTLEFDGAVDDPVPPEGVLDVGQKQADAIKAGLRG